MAGNPLIDQGVLNRLRGSVVLTDHPELNITASFLGEEAIRLALEGEPTTRIPTLTGIVQSPEPYQLCNVTVNLLKTQSLADAYKKQYELSTLLGNITVRPDSSALSPYSLINCSLGPVRELSFNGRDPGFVVSMGGYYLINSSLWNLG
ncbi:MAG: hypothetical protein KGL39_51470 [Patescibacteria group bacterium]|nr:hypothetical protein [Patescibacteria group bacterium]